MPPAPASDRQAQLRVTFLGVSTLLLDDGETAILTDGFFSRPDAKTVFTGKIAPDLEIIQRSLQHAGIKQLSAVIVAHSHYDHAMDAPEVARRTNAVLVGSESTANVGRGWGIKEPMIKVVRDAENLNFGRFQLKLIRSQHAPTGFTGGTIDAPLVPPVRANTYKEGQSFSILLTHEGKSILIHSSAGFEVAALQGQHADVVFLGIGTLGTQSKEFQETYWKEVVARVGAQRVIPIHWDNFFLPLDQPLQAGPRPFDNIENSMRFLLTKGKQEKVEIRLAPAWVVIDPFFGLMKVAEISNLK
ncbi:MBL fold metallo-hydrolase [Undibacterium sp. RuTC16W]|uniref:MBL fold metallo-hydrolase n=1 Tax=Undibacterium sp. RuTC16W TaxID=3413048 RepID=UPI003BF436FE